MLNDILKISLYKALKIAFYTGAVVGTIIGTCAGAAIGITVATLNSPHKSKSSKKMENTSVPGTQTSQSEEEFVGPPLPKTSSGTVSDEEVVGPKLHESSNKQNFAPPQSKNQSSFGEYLGNTSSSTDSSST